MDDIVKQAMQKWPNVPDCYGWLGLDARGNWYMCDQQAQAQGAFASGAPGSKGAMLRHDKLIEFIGRNYAADAKGRWFFQNGPQRVFVELEATPLIWRIQTDLGVTDHIGRGASVRACVLDETGRLYLQTDSGFGLVHTLDMERAAEAIERELWHPQELPQDSLPVKFFYVKSPQAQV